MEMGETSNVASHSPECSPLRGSGHVAPLPAGSIQRPTSNVQRTEPMRDGALRALLDDTLLRNPFPAPLVRSATYRDGVRENHAAAKAQASQVRANVADCIARVVLPEAQA